MVLEILCHKNKNMTILNDIINEYEKCKIKLEMQVKKYIDIIKVFCISSKGEKVFANTYVFKCPICKEEIISFYSVLDESIKHLLICVKNKEEK